MQLFLDHIMQCPSPEKEMRARIALDHFGFGKPGIEQYNPNLAKFAPGAHLFVALRDAKEVINSTYWRLRGRPNIVLPKSIDEFAVGSRGMARFCAYLEKLCRLLKKSTYQFTWIYYEDLFMPQSLHLVPEMLGMDYSLSETEVGFLHQYSSIDTIYRIVKQRQGTREEKGIYRNLQLPIDPKHGHIRRGVREDYKQHMSPKTQQAIDDYLDSECKLQQYRERYL